MNRQTRVPLQGCMQSTKMADVVLITIHHVGLCAGGVLRDSFSFSRQRSKQSKEMAQNVLAIQYHGHVVVSTKGGGEKDM